MSLYLSTNVLKFEYFLPVGNLTLIHLGLDELILGTDDFVSIFISDDIKAFFTKINYSFKTIIKYPIEKVDKKIIPVKLSILINFLGLYFSGICLLVTKT